MQLHLLGVAVEHGARTCVAAVLPRQCSSAAHTLCDRPAQSSMLCLCCAQGRTHNGLVTGVYGLAILVSGNFLLMVTGDAL